ncbi:MAG: diguanylate cyclase [Campylobacterota bacterium]|nr:diguanylate cyclase [Campylobacterota bacterium]
MNSIKIVLLIFFTCNTLFSQELEKVSLQLQWLHQFQFAGFYVAKEKDYYKDAGLDVEIKAFTHDTTIIKDVQNKKTTYATGRSSLLIHQSKYNDMALLDAIFEHSPSVLISTNPNIKHPRELKNRRIMVTDNQAVASSFYAMLRSQNVHPKDIIKQKHSFNLDDLIDGNTDAMACYISNEPFVLRKKGIDFSIMNPSYYGYDFYGDLLFTSKEELHSNPERAYNFVKASRKGWKEAFENIEATAKLIFKNYNTQNKSLESLIYEGEILKSLWCDDIQYGTTLSYARFERMVEFYRLDNLITDKPDLKSFIDPLGFHTQEIKIGVLAKRGASYAFERWQPLIEHMSHHLNRYHYTLVPLDFKAVPKAVEEKSVDFILTNSMRYVQIESHYGTSRLATLLNHSPLGGLSEFGAVIFTRADNKKINSLSDIKNRNFGAVNPYSFGGWIMARKTFLDAGITPNDFQSLEYFQTHDNVVNAVLSKKIDAGTVRTDTLENMAKEGVLNLQDIKLIHPQHFDDFPYLISTQLYPEWSFAKLAHTPTEQANALLSELLKPQHLSSLNLQSWSIPVNYKPVHDLLKDLKLDPYLAKKITFYVFIEQYRLWITLVILSILLLLIFNRYLGYLITKRTQELQKANKKLLELASTDELTGIANRRQFFEIAMHYFDIAKRNQTPLVILALDIDFFKQVNDTYGHDVGDEVLKLFTQTIEKILRKSDIIGRIGGEEFSIALQNTYIEDALKLAEKIRYAIENTPYIINEKESVQFCVSIGVSTLHEKDKKLSELMKRSDEALYLAKREGRNCVHTL